MARAHRQLTRATAVVLIALGVAMLVATLARGGGPLSLGVLLGVSFAVFGGARLLLARETTTRG